MDTQLPCVSLFSGAGGLDLGLESQGFATRVFVEVDKDAQATLVVNADRRPVPSAPVLGDITQLDASDILRAADLDKGEAALLAGGPPCQSFSTAGKRASVSDPRGSMLAHFGRVVAGVQPRFFVFENVRGLLSSAISHRPLSLRGVDSDPLSEDEQLGSVLNRVVLPMLRDELGYEVVYGLVNAADYGVPQTRQRVLFLGSRDREFGTERWPFLEQAVHRLMPPTHSLDSSSGLPRWVTLGDAIGGLKEANPEVQHYSPARRRILELVPAGKNWRYLREHLGDEFLREVMGGAYSANGGKVGFWRRLSFEKPCPTVPTSPIQKGTCLCHPEETRPLTVREYARVQQFPDDYEFRGSIASKYKQIGNAVPVGLGQAIGRAICDVMHRGLKVAEKKARYGTKGSLVRSH